MNPVSLAILSAVGIAAIVSLVVIFKGRKRCNSACDNCSLRDNCKKL